MSIETFIREMPKVELHVHLEGAIQPETLLDLAKRNRVSLPADSEEGLREWYTFTGFDHFIRVYLLISSCIQTAQDIEWMTRRFLEGQAAQRIMHSEVTYTAYTIHRMTGMSFEEQLAAINRARAWAEKELGVGMTLTIDISRMVTPEEGMVSADMAVSGIGRGVSAFGLGGPESGNPPEKFTAAFERARAAGLPSVPHAGEIEGAASVWGALRSLHADRIGHGVRCLEDPALVEDLRRRQVPLEVCPTSNVCLKVAPSLAQHPLPRLMAEGLYVTLNSDDPPMFNTSLTDEYLKCTATFGFSVETVEGLALNALRASFLPPDKKQEMEVRFRQEYNSLRKKYAL